MKKLLPLFALGMFLTASTLSSCSKDNDPGTEQPSSEFTYVEPYHASGCDEATIQNFMASQKGYTFQEKQVINQQLNVFLTVYSKGESSYRVYTFQQGLLAAAYAYEEIKHYSEVKKYLDEHYILVHEEETYLAYTIPAKTKLITLGKESDKKGLLLVTYTIGINPDSSDDNTDVPNQPYVYSFIPPCLNWGCSKEQLNQYMTSWTGWKEETKDYYIHLESGESIMYTVFEEEGLQSSTVTYSYYNEETEKQLFADLKSIYGIELELENSTEQQYLTMKRYKANTVVINGKLTNCSVATSRYSGLGENTGSIIINFSSAK